MRVWMAVLLLMALVPTTQAQALQGAMHYRWTDAHGVRQFSDSLSADAIAQGYDVVNANGSVMQHVARPLTPAEQAQAAAAKAAQAKAEAEAQAQARADQQLLAAYPAERDLVSMQQEALVVLDGQIKTAEMNVKTQQQALTGLLNQAASVESEKKTVPVPMSDRVKAQQAVVKAQQDQLAHLAAERDQKVKDQATQLAHYRALKAAQTAAN